MSVKDAKPLTVAFADALKANFPTAIGDALTQVTVAVSGGGDSMALMHLAAEWAAARGIGCQVVTIDHGLRPESAAEAEFGAKAAAGIGLPHKTVTWSDWDGQGNLQDKARQARYRLIDAARGSSQLVLTGHTLEDQAETFLMRLKRGSGVDGLAGIPICRFVSSDAQDGGYWVLRPLLAVPRQSLRDHLVEKRLRWVEDPSNQDPNYERIQMRRLIGDVSAAGLTASVLAETATRMGQAKQALDQVQAKLMKSLTEEHHGDVSIDLGKLADEPAELSDRLVAAALCWVASSPYRPRYAALRRCLDAVREGAAQSLHGCVLYPWKERLRITREYQAVANLTVVATRHAVWDGRWSLDVSPPMAGRLKGWTIKPLGAKAAQAVRPQLRAEVPFRSLKSYPALFDQSGTLQTVPGLSKNPPFAAAFHLRRFDQSLITH